MVPGSINRVAIIGNHTPRQCGIATFTADLAHAIVGTGVEVQVVAMTDRDEGYDYPDIVKFCIDQHRIEAYAEAAEFLNSQHFDVICVQHEFGIFGGPAGSHLLQCLRKVNAPIVTTLHTVLQKPDQQQLAVITELSQLSERLIVMSQHGRAMLIEDNGINAEKIKIVCHGIPTVNRADTAPFREKLGLNGKRVILTFGLIAPDKGIEFMIQAMPAIVAEHPDALYLVVGATHPKVRSQRGEDYRTRLIQLAEELKVQDNVSFVDRFVSIDELKEFLQAADIYVTPYLKKDQITSGTLAYAYGSGLAVVSTPYWHAQELLADGRGILVPFMDPSALAREIGALLGDAARLKTVQDEAFKEGEMMRWPVIGAEYNRVFRETVEESRNLLPVLSMSTQAAEMEQGAAEAEAEFGLQHLLTLTDDTGILQHSTHCVPNRFEGYCTDDNARLGIVGCRLETAPGHARLAIQLQHTSLSFIHHAFNKSNGRFRNFMGFDRAWIESTGSEDSHGRAIWALGTLFDMSSVFGIRAVAKKLFDEALPAAMQFDSPRSMAFTILGLERVLAAEYCGKLLDASEVLGRKLSRLFTEQSDPQWRWFEDKLTYDNARLPQALMAAGRLAESDEMLANAKIALRWLIQIQTSCCGWFLPVGSNGFYSKDGVRANYDQQPLESAATIDACLEAFCLAEDPFWKDEARRAFNWYLGANSENTSLIDEDTGGCQDGLRDGGVNHNQGAESTLAFLASCLAVRRLERIVLRRRDRYLG